MRALRSELGSAARRSAIEGLIDQVGLRRDTLQRYPHEFSGGQRQRIAIARALAGAALLAARRSVQIIFQESSRRACARCARNWAALHAAAPSRA